MVLPVYVPDAEVSTRKDSGMDGEVLGIMAFNVVALLLFIVPFIDRGPENRTQINLQYHWRRSASLHRCDDNRRICDITRLQNGSIPAESSVFFDEAFRDKDRALSKTSFTVMVLLVLFTLASAQKKSSCIDCHVKLDDPRLSAPGEAFENDAHRGRGLSCNDCHGGDPNADTSEAAKDPRKGIWESQARSTFPRTVASAIVTPT